MFRKLGFQMIADTEDNLRLGASLHGGSWKPPECLPKVWSSQPTILIGCSIRSRETATFLGTRLSSRNW
jgi:hypothetical protein